MDLSNNYLFKNIYKDISSDINKTVLYKFTLAKFSIYDEEYLLNKVFYIIKKGIIISSKLND